MVAAAGATAAASAAPAKSPRSACQKFAKSHKDVARSAKLVTAVAGGEETGRIVACVLPRGRLRTLTSWDDGLARDWASVVTTAGTWVLVEDGHGDQYGGTSRSLTRHDVRSGRRLSLSGYGCQVGWGEPSSCQEGTSYGDVGVIATGAGAVELTDLATATTTLQAFSPAGVLMKLADGPVEALRMERPHAVWMQGGVEHRAPLPE